MNNKNEDLSQLISKFKYISISKLAYRYFFIILLLILMLSISTHILLFSFHQGYKHGGVLNLANVLKPNTFVIKESSSELITNEEHCHYWNCFNVYNCGKSRHAGKISVYVYPLKQYINDDGAYYTNTISKEFYEILETIANSHYYTNVPSEACIFIPSIDMLKMDEYYFENVSIVLQSLEYWDNNGENHLLFNMIRKNHKLPYTKAMWAASGQDTWRHRRNFDISLPIYSTLQRDIKNTQNQPARSWLVISPEMVPNSDLRYELKILEMNYPDLLVLTKCKNSAERSTRCKNYSNEVFKFLYPEILQKTVFCILFRNTILTKPSLMEVMASNCIPVIVADNIVMPFAPYIDWKRASIFILERNLNNLMETLKSVSEDRISEMQKQVKWLYKMYFENMKKITLTTLNIIQDRVYPQFAKVYDEWNIIPEERSKNPLFLPQFGVRTPGFTAVILTYDRVHSLFTLIDKLSRVSSLAKVLVVWNNQKKSPPNLSAFPKINKPIKVVQTKFNKLSNRFFPYEEIETEAILSIDDDIIMLTPDELEFGFEVWREFPDRIVGFPSRTHRWDNVSNSWRYESEWTNDISMVLTGAAFLHKYWSHAYMTQLPEEIRVWVDEHMNCEDIAMNFLVANITNKAPIKVAPRKKFKCPECTNTEMLSADIGHMIERSACVDRFVHAFGRMPLKAVEFRADPVLYRDPFPEKLKRFNDIGSL